MKHICFVTTGDIRTIATAKRALGLANHLVNLGWRVTILMQDTEENRHRVAMECTDSVQAYYFPWTKAKDEQRWKTTKIRELNPDVVYYCAFVGRNICARRHHSIKIVEHSELQSKFKEAGFIRRMYYYGCEFYSIRFADGLLNASKYLDSIYKKRAARLGKKHLPMLWYPYAYNKDVCRVEREKALQIIEKDSKHRYFVFMGSLVRNYGAFTMIEAFEKIKDSHPHLKLLLMGRGRHFNEVNEYIEQHGLKKTIKLLGYVPEEEIATYFSLADAFLLPLHDTIQDWARCPSKLYMYLPYQRPIITCKIGEPYEVLGDKGTYFHTDSVDSLTKTILQLAEKDEWNLDIKPAQHEWKARAEQLDEWLKTVIMH